MLDSESTTTRWFAPDSRLADSRNWTSTLKTTLHSRIKTIVSFPRSVLAVFLAVTMVAVLVLSQGVADGQESGASTQSLPGWLPESSAASLDVGITVLVPGVVPAPFGGTPSISAYPGFYSLYWLVPGSPPTYLRITGESGGVIPDYSAADRNVPLTQNATVNGYPAWHDLTEIYDLVYWQIGSVVYSVDSRSMSGTDSLSLAESLTALDLGTPDPGGEAPDDGGQTDGPVVTLTVPGAVEAGGSTIVSIAGGSGMILSVNTGNFSDGSLRIRELPDGEYAWFAPKSVGSVATFVVSDPATGDWLASATTEVVAPSVDESVSLACPDLVQSGGEASLTLQGSGRYLVAASDGSFGMSGINAEFAPTDDGGARIGGTIAGSGESNLLLTMPETDEDLTVRVTVSDQDGVERARCAFVVIADGNVTSTTASTNDILNAPPHDGTTVEGTGVGWALYGVSGSPEDDGMAVDWPGPTPVAYPGEQTDIENP